MHFKPSLQIQLKLIIVVKTICYGQSDFSHNNRSWLMENLIYFCEHI